MSLNSTLSVLLSLSLLVNAARASEVLVQYLFESSLQKPTVLAPGVQVIGWHSLSKGDLLRDTAASRTAGAGGSRTAAIPVQAPGCRFR